MPAAPRPQPKSPHLFFALLLSALAGCGWLHPRPSWETKAGESIEIRLPANFSTGYRWVLDPPLQAARVLSESYEADSPGPKAGAPGTQRVRVIFPREGRFNLKFAYRRLWEASTLPPAKTTNLVVNVLPANNSRPWLETLLPHHQESNSSIPQPEEEDPQATTRKVELRRAR